MRPKIQCLKCSQVILAELSAASYSWFSRTPYKRLSDLLHLLICHRWPTSAFPFTHAPCLLKLCIQPSNGIVRWWLLLNLVRNCRWTIVTDRHSLNVSTQNAFSLPFAAILVNCAPSGEMHNYCTRHIIKENFEISWSIGATVYSYLKCVVYDK